LECGFLKIFFHAWLCGVNQGPQVVLVAQNRQSDTKNRLDEPLG
jgi:hypothetical protein